MNQRLIEVKLSDNSTIFVEEVYTSAEEEVSGGILEGRFSEILPSVVALCQDFSDTFKQVSPSKATVQFSLKLAVESTGLIALVGKANAEANFQVTLEWDTNNS